MHATGAALLFGLWGVAALFIILDFLLAFRKQFRTRARLLVDRDGDGTITTAEVAVQAYENVSLRLQALLAAIASESIVGTMFRFIVFMLPWPFYVAVFRTCWDCFDFEAAAAHVRGARGTCCSFFRAPRQTLSTACPQPPAPQSHTPSTSPSHVGAAPTRALRLHEPCAYSSPAPT